MLEFFKKLTLLIAFVAVSGVFAVTAYVIYRSTDAVAQAEALLLNSHNRIEKALFSPDDPIKEMLLTLIDNEKKSIKIATYTFTEKELTHAILRAYARGISIEFVVDRGYAGDRFSRIGQFADKQIPIWVFQTSPDDRNAGLMHNKFMIFEDSLFDRAILCTGSYNYTKRAGTANQENVIISDSENLIQSFRKQFDILKTRSIQISGNPIYTLPIQEQKKSSLLNWIERMIILR